MPWKQRLLIVVLSLVATLFALTACEPQSGTPTPTLPPIVTCSVGERPDTYQEQITYYENLLEDNPGCWNARRDLALAYREEGLLQEALSAYHLALREDIDLTVSLSHEELARTYHDRGYTYRLIAEATNNSAPAQETFQLAIADYLRAEEFGYIPLSGLYSDLGYLYAEIGDAEQAISYHDRAIEFEENRPPYGEIEETEVERDQRFNVYLRRGDYYEQTGQCSDALADYEKAEEIYERINGTTFPSDNYVREYIERGCP